MPNLNYAQVWEQELLDILIQGTLISPFITSKVKWLDAKTFHFTSMSTSGYKNHSRTGGWNTGEYAQTDHPYTLEHDRDIEFLVDQADVDETNATASIQNISNTFEKTQAVPEADALFFSKVAKAAKSASGYSSTNALSTWTKENVFSRLKSFLSAGKLRRYRASGALIMYVRSEIMDLLERSTEFTRKIELTQIAEGGMGIETRITDIDGVVCMEVIDDDRFYDAFNWSPEHGGFEPAAGASKINVLIASPLTCKFVPKISSIYYFAPGSHTKGDGYLYQNRNLSDVFVFPNGKDGLVDSVYVDTDSEMPHVEVYPDKKYAYHGVSANTLTTTGVEYAVGAGDTTDYMVSLSGTAAKLSSAAKTALWGADAPETNAAVMLVEIPSEGTVTYNGSAASDKDIYTGKNERFLILCLGLYKDGGTIKSSHANETVTVAVGGVSKTFKFDYTNLNLAN